MPDETTVHINEFAFEKAFFAMFCFRLSWALTRWKRTKTFCLRFLLIGVKAYQGWTQKIQEKGAESPTLPFPRPPPPRMKTLPFRTSSIQHCERIRDAK